MKTNTKKATASTKIAKTAKTAKTAAKPSAAVKSVKTAKGHTLAAVKGGKLVKIAECVHEDATAAKPKAKQPPNPSKPSPAPVKAEAKPQKPAPKPPEASKPPEAVETWPQMVARQRREVAEAAKFEGKSKLVVSMPWGDVPSERCKAVAAVKFRHFQERWQMIAKQTEATFKYALDAMGGDPRLALFSIAMPFHDDRGDGLLHVPMFGGRGNNRLLKAWKHVAEAGGYKFAAEAVCA